MSAIVWRYTVVSIEKSRGQSESVTIQAERWEDVSASERVGFGGEKIAFRRLPDAWHDGAAMIFDIPASEAPRIGDVFTLTIQPEREEER